MPDSPWKTLLQERDCRNQLIDNKQKNQSLPNVCYHKAFYSHDLVEMKILKQNIWVVGKEEVGGSIVPGSSINLI